MSDARTAADTEFETAALAEVEAGLTRVEDQVRLAHEAIAANVPERATAHSALAVAEVMQSAARIGLAALRLELTPAAADDQ